MSQKLATLQSGGFCFSPGEPVECSPLDADTLKHIQRRTIWVMKGLNTLRKRNLSVFKYLTVL